MEREEMFQGCNWKSRSRGVEDFIHEFTKVMTGMRTTGYEEPMIGYTTGTPRIYASNTNKII